MTVHVYELIFHLILRCLLLNVSYTRYRNSDVLYLAFLLLHSGMIGIRIHKIRQRYQLSQAQLASKLVISQGYLSELEHGVKSPGFGILESLKQCFPELDANWLLTGKGRMLIADSHDENGSDKTFAEMQAKIDALSSIIVKACVQGSFQPAEQESAEVLRMKGISPTKVRSIKELNNEGR